MNYFLFKIEFSKNVEDLNFIYENLSDLEKEKISQMEVVSSFDCEGLDDNYICYLMCSKTEINLYLSILDNNLISYICTDISQSVIDNDINLEKELIQYVNTINFVNYDNFIDDTNEWIYQNLDLDSILDRINKSGINSLRPIDQYFLLNQSK